MFFCQLKWTNPGTIGSQFQHNQFCHWTFWWRVLFAGTFVVPSAVLVQRHQHHWRRPPIAPEPSSNGWYLLVSYWSKNWFKLLLYVAISCYILVYWYWHVLTMDGNGIKLLAFVPNWENCSNCLLVFLRNTNSVLISAPACIPSCRTKPLLRHLEAWALPDGSFPAILMSVKAAAPPQSWPQSAWTPSLHWSGPPACGNLTASGFLRPLVADKKDQKGLSLETKQTHVSFQFKGTS